MGFYGSTLIFNDISSDAFGLYIGSIGGREDSSLKTTGEIIKDKTAKQTVYNLFGVDYSTPLEFKITLYAEKYIDRNIYSKVERWLSSPTYKKLRIVQEDLQSIWFNCILKEFEPKYAGNQIVGLSFSGECDAPWAWEDKPPISLVDLTGINQIEFNNLSDHQGYIYPTIRFKTLSDGDIKIKNSTDNRELIFHDLSAGDEIEVQNNLQIIKTITGLDAFKKCNYHWLRLIPDLNQLIVEGDFEYITLQYTLPRKVGN